VQYAGEDRPLQREAETTAGGQALDHRGAAGLLPQPAKGNCPGRGRHRKEARIFFF